MREHVRQLEEMRVSKNAVLIQLSNAQIFAQKFNTGLTKLKTEQAKTDRPGNDLAPRGRGSRQVSVSVLAPGNQAAAVSCSPDMAVKNAT